MINPGDLTAEQIVLVWSEAHLLKKLNTEVAQCVIAGGFHVIMIT